MRKREDAANGSDLPPSEKVRFFRRKYSSARVLGWLSRRRPACRALLLAALVLCILLALYSLLSSAEMARRAAFRPTFNDTLAETLVRTLSSRAAPLCSVTGGPAACAAWRWALSADGSVGPMQTPYTVVVGAQSTDNLRGRRMRPLHRATWMTDASVARRANNFEGRMLVVSVLAEHHTRAGRGPSDALRGEAETAADILWLRGAQDPPLCEVEDGEECGVGRKRGLLPEWSQSRKTATWFAFARRQFPRASYYGKTDDDTYLRPSLILGHLDALATLRHPIAVTPEHLKKLYWGYIHGRDGELFYWGLLYILGSEAVDAVFRNEPHMLSALLGRPDRRKIETYVEHKVFAEDAMIGRFVSLNARADNIFYVGVGLCFMHDLPRLPHGREINPNSICIHRMFPEEMPMIHEQVQRQGPPQAPLYRLWDTRLSPGLIVDCA